MTDLLDVQIQGWLQTVVKNFSLLGPLIGGVTDGLGVMRVAKFTFDTAVAANLAIGAHASDIIIPANAVVVGGFVDVNTAFTSEDTNTCEIAISVEGANDIITAAAVSGAPYSSIGLKAIIPKANTPESTGVKTTVARAITITTSVAVLTAGKLTGNLYYLEGLVSA